MNKRHGFSLIELLVVLLILGVLVGLAVPQYLESQKSARVRTFAANVRQIIDALEAYKADDVWGSNGQYPQSLLELKNHKYFTQEPINPYTGASMLNDEIDAGIAYETSDGETYTLIVTQSDNDDLDKDVNTNELLCTIDFVKQMLPNKACPLPPVSPVEDFSDLLVGFTYNSRIEDFTPIIIDVATQTITGDGGQQMTLVIPNIKPPSYIVRANYNALVFATDEAYFDEYLGFIRETFGNNNVTLINVGVDLNVDPRAYNAFSGVASVLSPFNNPNVTIPLAVILDEDGTLLAVFDWPPYSMNADELLAIATLGKGYSGVYLPYSIYEYDIRLQNFTLLSDQQKIQIRDALLPVYPDIKTNVD